MLPDCRSGDCGFESRIYRMTLEEKKIVDYYLKHNFQGAIFYNEKEDKELLVTKKALKLGYTPPKGFKRIY